MNCGDGGVEMKAMLNKALSIGVPWLGIEYKAKTA
jgi:hypothetical protein